MTHILKNVITPAYLWLLLSSCGILSSRSSPAEIGERFYSRGGTEPLPGELFADEQIKRRVERLIARKESMMGAYISHQRIGSKRRIVLENGVRKNIAVFIFEVTSEGGRTAETLTISRDGPSRSYCITAYEVENIPERGDRAPIDANSA